MDTENRKSTPPARPVHVYDDDIHEEDNALPAWWRWALYGSIVFAALYWFGEQKMKAWPSVAEAYQDEMVAVHLAQAKAGGGVIPAETIVALSRAPATVDAGKKVFGTTCAPCHRADGGGNIGPNLTDEYWLHGGGPQDIWRCVHEGVPNKGMPTWGPQIGDEKVAAVVAYVLTIRNSHVPGGKLPQGEKVVAE